MLIIYPSDLTQNLFTSVQLPLTSILQVQQHFSHSRALLGALLGANLSSQFIPIGFTQTGISFPGRQLRSWSHLVPLQLCPYKSYKSNSFKQLGDEYACAKIQAQPPTTVCMSVKFNFFMSLAWENNLPHCSVLLQSGLCISPLNCMDKTCVAKRGLSLN